MLAHVRNTLHDLDLHLQLVQVGDRFAWKEMESGEYHGVLHADVQTAVRGLRRYYCEPGTEVRYKAERSDHGLTLVSSAA